MTSFEDDQREEAHRQQRQQQQQQTGGWCPFVLAGIAGVLALAIQTLRSLGQTERTGR